MLGHVQPAARGRDLMQGYSYNLKLPQGYVIESNFAKRFDAHDRASLLARIHKTEIFIEQVSPYGKAIVGKADTGGYVSGIGNGSNC